VIELPSSVVVTPGLIDIHVHLREPGQDTKSDCHRHRVAVTGGFTAVACMPNTDPVNDNASVTQFIRKRAAEVGLARVYPIGAVSIGQKGEQLTESAISTRRLRGDYRRWPAGGDGAADAARARIRVNVQDAGDRTLRGPDAQGDGVAHEGAVAAMLGLKGIPGIAESVMAERDISIAELMAATSHRAYERAPVAARRAHRKGARLFA
jgi:dihydroorotase